MHRITSLGIGLGTLVLTPPWRRVVQTVRLVRPARPARFFDVDVDTTRFGPSIPH